MSNHFQPQDQGCSGYRRLPRRAVVHAGVLGLGGLTLADLDRVQAANGRKEISCILLWLRGGPSSIDMWDLKPEAPSEIRGPFKPIRTNVAGMEISEHLPRLAKVANLYTLVRSVTHPREDHEGGSHVNSTGWDTWPRQKYPMYGSVVQKLKGYAGSVPPHVHLPEIPQEYTGGEHYLARQDLPFVVACSNDLDLRVKDIAPSASLSADRLRRRRALVEDSRGAFSDRDGLTATSALSTIQNRALELVAGSGARAAFDITRESASLRSAYGRGQLAAQVVAQGNAGDVAPNEYNRSIIGQGLLMARRLVENGCRFVTVVGRGWDTHADNFNRLKDQLLPHLDQSVAALLTDLQQRGMLDTTLVVVTGDFNRTPKINKDAGRDHWGYVQTIFLAGAGIPGGTVIGSSDPHCAYPADRPISPQDIAASIYSRFGIRPEQEIVAPDGRPYRVLPEGAKPVPDLG